MLFVSDNLSQQYETDRRPQTITLYVRDLSITQGFSESNFVSAVDDFNQFKPSIEGCHRRVEQIVHC